MVYGTALGIFLVLIAWGPTTAFRRPISIAVMAVLGVVGIEAFRRFTAREFPDAEPAPLAIGRRAERAAPRPEPNRYDDLERLAALHAEGVVDDDEFAAQKALLLTAPPSTSERG